MAVPTKKIYGRNGKVIFDPSNPEDVRNYKEKEPLMEALKLVQGLADPRGGGGLTGATKIISRTAKSKFARNKAKQILDFVSKPMTRGKRGVPKTRKQATPTVKEIVETKPTIPTTVPSTTISDSDRIKSLIGSSRLPSSKPEPNLIELLNAKKRAKDYEAAKNTLAEKRKPSLRGYTPEEAKKVMRDILAKNKGKQNKVAERRSLEGKIISLIANKETGFRASVKQSIEESNAKSAMSIGALAAVLGGGAGATYYGSQLSNKDNKQTTTPQKTGPVDLKRINKSKLKPSNIEGVQVIRGVDGKDYGIKWDNKTQSWDYYRGGGTKVKPQEPVKNEKTGLAIGGGDSDSGSKGNNNSGTGGSGGSSVNKPRSTTGQAFDKAFAEARKQAGGAGGIFEFNNEKYGTALEGETVPKDRVEVGKSVAPVTTTYVGNEYAKANNIEQAIQNDSITQQRNMFTEKLSKPLSSLVFKTSSKAVDVRNVMDEQDALRSIRENNKLPLNKKRYGGNLAMLKYMKK